MTKVEMLDEMVGRNTSGMPFISGCWGVGTLAESVEEKSATEHVNCWC